MEIRFWFRTDCFIVIILRWSCILVQRWLFHYYYLTMGLYFGSELTVSLLSYDGLVFWFRADCFIIIVLQWPCILVQNWLFHYCCLTMALYFGSELTVSLLLSYDGLVYYIIFSHGSGLMLFSRTDNMHMTTSLSRRLNKSFIMFKIIAFFLPLWCHFIPCWTSCGKICNPLED